jgi:hypothetical protein
MGRVGKTFMGRVGAVLSAEYRVSVVVGVNRNGGVDLLCLECATEEEERLVFQVAYHAIGALLGKEGSPASALGAPVSDVRGTYGA